MVAVNSPLVKHKYSGATYFIPICARCQREPNGQAHTRTHEDARNANGQKEVHLQQGSGHDCNQSGQKARSIAPIFSECCQSEHQRQLSLVIGYGK